jgi:hypothetical protein
MKERSLHLLCAQQMYRFAITAFAGMNLSPRLSLIPWVALLTYARACLRYAAMYSSTMAVRVSLSSPFPAGVVRVARAEAFPLAEATMI